MSRRRSVRAAVAAATALSVTAATVPAPAEAAPIPFESLPQQEILIGGMKVPVPAASLAVAGLAAALGGLSVFILQAIIDATGGRGEGSAPEKPKPADPKPEDPAQLTYLNRFDFGAVNKDKQLGGLSGIELVDQDRLIAISDDKGEHGPIRAYYFTVSSDGTTFTADGKVEFTQTDGTPYADYLDPEEIRLLPNGNFLWTTEGAADKGKFIAPQLIESTRDGKEVRRINTPKHHAPDEKGTTGVQNNKGPEAMTLLNGKILTINEDALAQDVQKNSGGALSRITLYDATSGQPVAEHAVRVNPERGVTSVLADENGQLYMLERGFNEKTKKNMAQIYKLDLTGADDVLNIPALTGQEKLAEKQLVFDFDKQNPHPDNVEGLAWGPLVDGERTIVVVSDDNFSDKQSTLMHTLRVPA